MSTLEKNPITPDQPLPGKLIDKLGSWSVKAQHYPVFSQTWFRYRALGFTAPLGVLALIMLIISVIVANEKIQSPEAERPYLMFLVLYLGIALNLLGGRWLATQVKKRQWQKKNEMLGIASGLILGIALSLVIVESADRLVDKKMKKTSPETKEKLHELSKSNEVKMGIVITAEQERDVNIANIMLWIVLLSWWGGVLDFRTYLKQRRELEEASIQEKLDQYKNERNQAQMRLSVLASQVEPHFLFNTLSGVRAAMLSDPARGVAIIDHLVDYLRSTIPQMRSDGNLMLSSVDNQFNSVRAYLGVIHMRIPRLSFSVECPPDLMDCAVPPLMLISLVENAVKHGIEPKKGPVHIAVKASKIPMNDHTDGEQLCLSVEDNGVGFGHSTSGSGIGLNNIRERLKHLYAGDASLELSMREEGGIVARILLPLTRCDKHSS
jgi:signal transduction histidine kinase